MPKPKSYRGRAIGMVGATIAMGALTIMSVKRGVKETIRLKQDSQKFEQRFEQRQRKTAELRRQIQKQHQIEIDLHRKKHEQRLAEPKLNVSSVLLSGIPIQNKISHSTFASELVRFKSPLANKALSKRLFNYCVKNNLDPTYFLAKSRIESHHGTDRKNVLNKNVGNLRARKGEKIDLGGFRVFGSFEEGAKAMIDRLVSKVYIGGGRTTVENIEIKYAPAIENPTNQNIRVIHQIKNQLYKQEFKRKKTVPKKMIPKHKRGSTGQYA
jgi:hypothetical protein